MPVTLASLETATPVAVKPAPTGKVAAGEPAPTEELPATDGDDAGASVAAAMPGLIVAAIPVPPPVTGSGQADAAPVRSQDGGRHQTTAAVAAAPAAVTPPTGGAVATDRADPKPAAASPAITSGLRAVRDEATPADARPATAARAAAPDTPAFANLVEQKAAPVAAAPAAQPAPVPEARVPAEPGRMGHGMAVAIARHTAEGGGEALTVRLNPAEFGRIDVTLSFDDRGTLRAVLAAETPAALDMLRRDSADLGRALSDAGMRTDAQSFRFDTRQGGADAGGQGTPGGHRWQPGATPRTAATATNETAQPEYRPLRTRGGVDLMA
jgi:flagellar hook-length control protein FliK